MLIVTIFLLFISAWNLNIFLRLNSCNKLLDENDKKICGLSRDYIRGGLFIGYFLICFSIFLFIILLVKIYMNMRRYKLG